MYLGKSTVGGLISKSKHCKLMTAICGSRASPACCNAKRHKASTGVSIGDRGVIQPCKTPIGQSSGQARRLNDRAGLSGVRGLYRTLVSLGKLDLILRLSWHWSSPGINTITEWRLYCLLFCERIRLGGHGRVTCHLSLRNGAETRSARCSSSSLLAGLGVFKCPSHSTSLLPSSVCRF